MKRRARSTQELADRLIDAPTETIAALVLPEKLADALALARKITSHGAALRQRQFVGKLMRGVDPEPIRLALEADAESSRQEAARFRRAERWRDRLVAERDAAIASFLAEFPAADPAELKSRVADAIAERRDGRPGGASRRLFRLIQTMIAPDA